MRHAYAVRYPYGVASRANSGEPARIVASFESVAERDAYVRQGGDYRTQSNWRESIRRADLTRRERARLGTEDGRRDAEHNGY